MAKLGKFLVFTALAGAAAAGVYYYLSKDEDSPLTGDFSRDVDNFFENKKTREYVPLDNEPVDENKAAMKNVVEQVAEELREKEQEDLAEQTGIIRDDSQEAADFAFKEFKDDEEPLK
ncbi:MAG: hypothetical protein IJU25_05120 [Lachnospiraceae bacterium]|nr:hypothetical protein [Lachnospiraceae bacterium]MCR5268012.1 hypothetical protein [Lachnospiraceae bacterium]